VIASFDILALTMSPRMHGNSDLLLESFLAGAEEAGARCRRIDARDLDVRDCTECGACDETGECILVDDMEALYPLLAEAPRVVVASPIFFYNVPAVGKAVIDRCQALWNRMHLHPELKRPDGAGFFLGVGATRGKNLFEGTLLTITYFLDAIGLPCRVESLTYRRVEGKGAIQEHPTALAEAREAGRAFALGKGPANA